LTPAARTDSLTSHERSHGGSEQMSESGGQDIRVRGTLHSSGGLGVVRIEMVVPTPPVEVWAAVTRPERLAKWLGAVDGDLREGGSFHALLFPSEWDGAGRILECEPGRRWLVESAEPGHALSTNELEVLPEGEGSSRVVFTQRGMPLPMIWAYGVGVQLHVENLAAHLAGRGPVDPDPFWEQLRPRYEELAAEL
jgi:uncharacterized protein YndB with AHSA1/START domain